MSKVYVTTLTPKKDPLGRRTGAWKATLYADEPETVADFAEEIGINKWAIAEWAPTCHIPIGPMERDMALLHGAIEREILDHIRITRWNKRHSKRE